jgi:hypothetical protein
MGGLAPKLAGALSRMDGPGWATLLTDGLQQAIIVVSFFVAVSAHSCEIPSNGYIFWVFITQLLKVLEIRLLGVLPSLVEEYWP